MVLPVPQLRSLSPSLGFVRVLLLPLSLVPCVVGEGLSVAFAVEGSVPAAESPVEETRKADKGPLIRAKALIDAQREDDALDLLRAFLAAPAKPEAQAEAYLLMASAYSGKKAYADAAAWAERLLSDFPKSEWAIRARIVLGSAQAQLGKPDAALSALAEARSLASDVATRREALQVTGEVQAAKKDYARAIQAWLEDLALAPDDQKGEAQERIRRLVQELADRTALGHLRDAFPTTFPGDLVLIRLIEMNLARGEDHLAERNLRLFLTHFPNHAYAPTAVEHLQGFKTKLKASQYVIAAALPTSGRLAPFGTEVLNGIRLALERAKDASGAGPIGLVVKDSSGMEKASLQAELTDVINEYRPLAVIGPLLSRHLPTAAAVGEQTETPFITPAATVADVRRLGTYLFTTALTYPQQARKLADYALGRLGYKRFVVLHPETPYGQELSRLFIQEIRQRGAEIIAVESYADNATDFGPQIKRLKEEDLKREGKATPSENAKGVTKLLYEPGFDAVFLPGSSAQIALLAPQLRFHDIKVPLLGSNAWNSPDLLRLTDRSIDGSVFVDALFQDSPDAGVRDFIERYRRKYQSNPSAFAAQAYDATRFVLEAVKKGASSGKAVREQLLKSQDLPSLAGPAAFGPGGALDRRIFLIQVRQGKLLQIE